MHTVNQRRGLFTAFLLSVVVLTGCNPTSESQQSNGGPFIVARTADIDGRDPAVATAFQTLQTLGLVYDTLVETNDASNLPSGSRLPSGCG